MCRIVGDYSREHINSAHILDHSVLFGGGLMSATRWRACPMGTLSGLRASYLALQGLPLHKLILNKETPSELQNLAQVARRHAEHSYEKNYPWAINQELQAQ